MSSGTAEQSASEASKGHAGILVGRYFTLSALCNPEELARARQVIKSQGGKVRVQGVPEPAREDIPGRGDTNTEYSSP